MPRSDYILCSLRPIPCDSERQRAFIILYIPTNQDTSFLTLTWKASTTILQKVLFLHVLSPLWITLILLCLTNKSFSGLTCQNRNASYL